ncbi:MAG: hypothetical protein E6J10_12595, partial [Chloroflexi bacterium]
MKRQFEPSNTSQGLEHHPEQSFDEWFTAGVHPDIPPAQPQEGPPPQVIRRPAGKGLLSSWKSSELQRSNAVANPAPISIIEQETLKQPAVQGPITGNGQSFSRGQVSPHQSGIPTQSPLFSESQTRQPFASQPLAPMAGPPQLQPLQPFGPVPIPGQSQAQWQAMGFQGAAPPFVQGLPIQAPGYGPQSKSRQKKRHFPMWARVVVSILLVILVLVAGAGYYYYANFAAP